MSIVVRAHRRVGSRMFHWLDFKPLILRDVKNFTFVCVPVLVGGSNCSNATCSKDKPIIEKFDWCRETGGNHSGYLSEDEVLRQLVGLVQYFFAGNTSYNIDGSMANLA